MVAIVSRICGRFSFSQAKMEDSEEFRSVMAQIVQRVNEKSEVIQTVVLVPTRETALQISQYIPVNIRCYACVGNLAELQEISESARIVVGTPGRFHKLMNLNNINLQAVNTVMLMQLDELQSRGFRDEILEILQSLPKQTQVFMSEDLKSALSLDIAVAMLKNPEVKIPKDLSLDGIQQFYVEVEHEELKFPKLIELCETDGFVQAVVFCNHSQKANWLSEELLKKKLSVSVMHQEMHEISKEMALRDFRSGFSRLLITTDLLILYKYMTVSLVICYEFPIDAKTYLHRFGRTGRFGRHGIAVSLVTNIEKQGLKEIETHFDVSVKELPADARSLLTG